MADLFSEIETPLPPIEPRDPNAHRAARPRLTRQSQMILDMLGRGRLTNGSLAGVTSRYGARIFDIRKWFEATGQTHLEIRIVEQNAKTGVVWYGLFDGGREVGRP